MLEASWAHLRRVGPSWAKLGLSWATLAVKGPSRRGRGARVALGRAELSKIVLIIDVSVLAHASGPHATRISCSPCGEWVAPS